MLPCDPNSEAMDRAILETMPGLMFVHDATGAFLAWRGQRSNLAMEPEQFMSRRLSDLFPKSLSELAEGNILEAIRTGAEVIFEYELETSGQGLRTYECRMVPFRDGTVLSLIVDITTRWEIPDQLGDVQP